MAKKKKEKITIKVRKGTAKQVLASINNEPVVNIVKLRHRPAKGKPMDAYITTNPQADNPRATLRGHTTETSAINRFRRFPQITPRLRKKL